MLTKTKKKSRVQVRMVRPKSESFPTVEYFIDEIPQALSTDEIQKRLDTLGAAGWELLFLGAYSSTPDTIRAYFMKRGSSVKKEK